MYNDFVHPSQGPKEVYEQDDSRGARSGHADRLKDILARLDAATAATDLNLPGFRLHPLKGKLKGFFAVTVRANWRVIFRFEGHNVADIDYVDYH